MQLSHPQTSLCHFLALRIYVFPTTSKASQRDVAMEMRPTDITGMSDLIRELAHRIQELGEGKDQKDQKNNVILKM